MGDERCPRCVLSQLSDACLLHFINLCHRSWMSRIWLAGLRVCLVTRSGRSYDCRQDKCPRSLLHWERRRARTSRYQQQLALELLRSLLLRFDRNHTLIYRVHLAMTSDKVYLSCGMLLGLRNHIVHMTLSGVNALPWTKFVDVSLLSCR